MTTNNLYFKTIKQTSHGKIEVEIRLDDKCKNGHTDFSITGSVYNKDKCTIYGCIHEEILKTFPEFKIFTDLHLCNVSGINVFFNANYMYYIRHKDSKALMSFGITEEEAEKLIDLADDDIFVRYFLNTCGYVERQREKAQKALQELERLTGNTFLDTAEKEITIPITEEERLLIEKRISDGYHTVENKEKRRIERIKARAQRWYNRESNQ